MTIAAEEKAAHGEACRQVESLADYVFELVEALDRNEVREGYDPDAFNDDGFKSWLSSWEVWRWSILNATPAQFAAVYTEGGFNLSLDTWRGGANGWWEAARKSGRIRTAKDAGSDPIDPGDDPPGKSPPKATPPKGKTPGKAPPGKSPPKVTPPKGKDEELDSNPPRVKRSTPWAKMLLVLGGVAAAIAVSRKAGGK